MNTQQRSFHLVLPSNNNENNFPENHAGEYNIILPRDMNLDQRYHWEMGLVEIFWPKQDITSGNQNLWYEKQEVSRRWKRTRIPSFLFLSVNNLIEFMNSVLRDKLDISYNSFTQSVILNVKNNVETTFKLRLSNMLARSLGLNITLDFPKDKNVAKVSKIWMKEARAEPNHSHHYIEIVFTPHQHLSSNDTPEDFNQPAFFHVQCNLAFPALVNGRFLNCLRTVETNKNETYKYLHHFVPKHIFYVPVRLTSFRQIGLRLTNDFNQTIKFSSGASVIVLHFRAVLI